MGKGRFLTVLFVLWIFAFSLASFLQPDRDFSESENRYLEKLPAFSVKSLLSGRFTEDFESYLNDQFIGRDVFVPISDALRYGVGLRELGGVYVYKNGALVQKTHALDTQQAARNARLVGDFSEAAAVPVTFALIPDAAELLSAQLPAGAPRADEAALIASLYESAGVGAPYSTLRSADILGALSAQGDRSALYYRTDHHWTSLGAYYGYAALGEALGYVPNALADYEYEKKTVSANFYGALYSNAPLWWLQPDSIQRYAGDAGVAVTAYSGTSEKPSALYVPENLQKRDQYTYFLGGNQPRIVIKSALVDAPCLLILRDSFTDSLVPYLAGHFSEIHLIDARYYKLPLSAYIAENGIDALLVLYSVKTFSEDANLPFVFA